MAKKKPKETEVREQLSTARRAVADAIRARPLTARDISRRTGLSEKVLPDHLEHLGRSLERAGERLEIRPAECLACQYAFEGARSAHHALALPEVPERARHPGFVRDRLVEEEGARGSGA